MTVERSFHPAPLEHSARVITGGTAVLAVAAGLLVGLRLGGPLVVVASPGLFVVAVIVPWAFAPAGYAVGSGQLAVLRRGARPLLFPLRSLQAARPTALPRSRRGTAVAGLFGWWGEYHNRDWGTFRMYATTRRRGVLLEWPGFRVYVSPQDRDGFRAACLAAGRPSGAGGRTPRAGGAVQRPGGDDGHP